MEQLGHVLNLFNMRVYLFNWWVSILVSRVASFFVHGIFLIFYGFVFMLLLVVLFIVFFSLKIGVLLFCSWLITSQFTWNLLFSMFSGIIPLTLLCLCPLIYCWQCCFSDIICVNSWLSWNAFMSPSMLRSSFLVAAICLMVISFSRFKCCFMLLCLWDHWSNIW